MVSVSSGCSKWRFNLVSTSESPARACCVGVLWRAVVDEELAVTVRDAAEKIGISQSLVYELIRLGVIRHSRHGRPGCRGTIRIPDEAVAEYLANCERAPQDEGADFKHIRVR